MRAYRLRRGVGAFREYGRTRGFETSKAFLNYLKVETWEEAGSYYLVEFYIQTEDLKESEIGWTLMDSIGVFVDDVWTKVEAKLLRRKRDGAVFVSELDFVQALSK